MNGWLPDPDDVQCRTGSGCGGHAGGTPVEGRWALWHCPRPPAKEFPPVLDAFDRLLDTVGGRVGLAGREDRMRSGPPPAFPGPLGRTPAGSAPAAARGVVAGMG